MVLVVAAALVVDKVVLEGLDVVVVVMVVVVLGVVATPEELVEVVTVVVSDKVEVDER